MKSESKSRRHAKKSKRRQLSPEELERRRRQRNASVRRLLYTREQTGEALGGISVSSVIRLEQLGKLRKVRPHGGLDKEGRPTGQVFNPVEDVEALASAVEG
jgi:hypothetical protein